MFAEWRDVHQQEAKYQLHASHPTKSVVANNEMGSQFGGERIEIF
jgi:hypothetical protein